MNKKDLYIPVNVVERNDYIEGFGPREVMITIVSFLIAVGIVIWMIISFGQIQIPIFLGVCIIGITIFMIRRDKFDESVIDKIFIIKRYYQAQKEFVYSYKNIYEGDIYGNQKTSQNDSQ